MEYDVIVLSQCLRGLVIKRCAHVPEVVGSIPRVSLEWNLFPTFSLGWLGHCRLGHI